MATVARDLVPASRPEIRIPLWRLARHLISFEALFALFIFSNRLQPILPPLPVDSTVVFGALALLVAGYVVLKEGIYTRALPVLGAALVLVLWITLSRAWSPGRGLASYSIAYIATFDMMCLGVGAFILAANRRRLVRFLLIVLGFSLFFAIYGIIIVNIYGSFRGLVGSLEANRMYLNWGYGVSAGALVAYCMALYGRVGSVQQIAAAIAFAIIGYFLLISSGRGPFLAVAVACVVPMALAWPRAARGRLDLQVSLVLGVVGLVTVVSYVTYLVVAGDGFHTIDRFSKLLDQTESPSLVQGPNRFKYWAAAWDFWLRSPVIGNGVASFSKMYYGFDLQGGHPHNIVLELLTNYGVVGLGLFGLMVAMAARQITFERLRHDRLLLCVLLLFLMRLTAALWNTELPQQHELFLFLGLLILRPRHPVAEPRRG